MGTGMVIPMGTGIVIPIGTGIVIPMGTGMVIPIGTNIGSITSLQTLYLPFFTSTLLSICLHKLQC
jgi:hypothetical protein